MKPLSALKIALEPVYTNMSQIEEQDPSNYPFGKLAVDLADFMGLPPQFVASKRFENGAWERLTTVIIRSGADIGLQKFVMYHNQVHDTSFSYPVQIGEMTFVIKRLAPSPNPSAILQPFSPFVWASLAVSMLAMTFSILYFFKKRNLSDSAFSVLATASRQAPFLQPKTTPERILMGSWLLGMTIITAAYLSLQFSYFTFPDLREPRTLLELANAVENRGYQCFTFQGHPFDHFRNSSIKAQEIIGKNLVVAGTLIEFSKLSATHVAFLISKELFKTFAPFYPELVISEDTFFSYLSAYPIRNDFRFKDKLNRALRRMIETGVYGKATAYPYPPYYVPSDKAQPTRKLTLLDFKVLFIMLLMGYGGSIIILLLELLAFKLESLKRRNC